MGALAGRAFSADDQRRFAVLTGDINPMHMDAVFARRTQAGAPVVHGIHMLLWLLDQLAARGVCMSGLAAKVEFTRIVHVGDPVSARLVEDGPGLRAEILTDGMVAVKLNFSSVLPPAPEPFSAAPARPLPTVPQEPSPAQMEGQQGRLAFAAPPSAFAQDFPHAAAMLGAETLAALGSTSLLVGMVVPGLHSIYGNLTFAPGGDTGEGFAYRVSAVLTRYNRVRVMYGGGGVTGMVEAFIRKPPAAQADMATLAGLVSRTDFAGTRPLVIGGSRGLGELTAGLLAMGGADVTVTYAVGSTDADAVCRRIMAAGGACRTARLDMRQDIVAQMAALPQAPTHVYYFATPAIFRQRTRLFSQEMFEDFNRFYVDGFRRVLQAGAAQGAKAYFYPSTVAVEDCPPNLLEYGMSKAAGELMCRVLESQAGARIHIARLPRLPTDQTATILNVPAGNPIEIMLPLIRAVQAA